MTAIAATLHPARWAELDLSRIGDVALLTDALESLRDRPCHTVLLTGAPAFALDLQWLRWFELFPLPTLYAFEGELGGVASGLALHCDIRVCSELASMRLAGLGGRRLLRLVGPDAMVDLIRARGHADARLALETGLASEVTASGDALARARELAATIASRGPIATRFAKEAIWRGLDMPLDRALRFETDLTLLLQTTKDRAEGVAAFLEKRQPRFTGE